MDNNLSHALVWPLMSSCAGMMLAVARERTGSLWLVVVHMILNLAGMYSNNEIVAGADMLKAVQYATKVAEIGLGLYAIATAWRNKPVGALPV